MGGSIGMEVVLGETTVSHQTCGAPCGLSVFSLFTGQRNSSSRGAVHPHLTRLRVVIVTGLS